MTLGRTSADNIKIKTDGGLRAVGCSCCGAAPPGCRYHYHAPYNNYSSNPSALPCQIYLGGTRTYTGTTWEGFQVWGGVSQGMLLPRNSGASYGDTTNGVFLENQGGYPIWAIYKNSVRSTSEVLIDGVRTHDTLASSYLIQDGYETQDEEGNWTGQCEFVESWPVIRISCDIWAAVGYGAEAKMWNITNSQCYDTEDGLSSQACWPSEYPYENFVLSPRDQRSLQWNDGMWMIDEVWFGSAEIVGPGWYANIYGSGLINFIESSATGCDGPQGTYGGLCLVVS